MLRVAAIRAIIGLGFVILTKGSLHDECLSSALISEEICKSISDAGFEGSFLVVSGDAINAASEDFGRISKNRPAAVLLPSSVNDVSKIIKVAYSSPTLTVSAYGNGHSLNGQAQALFGIVVNMTCLKGINVMSETSPPYVDASGGELWIDVLKATLEFGLSPRSFTDYLDLTVGGTLSNAGISGQTHRFGPQISNVLQLQVVTGNGDIIVCSQESNADLFYSVLGGLGQFGIITKARILLQSAHQRVRELRLVYSEVERFMHDQEILITRKEKEGFNYIEGMIQTNNNNTVSGWPSIPFSSNQVFNASLIPQGTGPHLYVIEIAQYYNIGDDVDQIVGEKVERLKYIRGLEFVADTTLFDFLNRVHESEQKQRAIGVWYNPHPWLNIFLPKRSVLDFNRKIFDGILRDGINGLTLFYPFKIDQLWNLNTSVILPTEDDVVYATSLLISTTSKSKPVQEMEQITEILRICREDNISFKLYLQGFNSQFEWIQHFGPSAWDIFVRRKLLYDPKAILAPGQKIFTRIP